jgi:hypothetical protein
MTLRFQILYAGLLLLATLPTFAEKPDQAAEDWYRNDYVPLWKEAAWDKLEEALRYYDEMISLHPPEGTIVSISSREWLSKSLRQWRSDGWLGSEVTELRSDPLNSTTVAFKAKWRDWYADGSEEYSCGWYVADRDQSTWVITQYAEIDCADHGL